MSTIVNQRIKKIIISIFVVAIIATIGLVVVHAHVTKNNQEISETKKNNVEDIENLEEETLAIKTEAVKVEKNTSASIPVSNFSKYKKVKVIATGYTAGVESTGKDESHPAYGITFSGAKVRRDAYSTIAADVNVFPLGTVLYIPDYGYGIVADTGSGIKGKKIDLYFETVSDVYEQWGKKEVDVYVIEYGKGAVSDKTIDQYNNVAAVNSKM